MAYGGVTLQLFCYYDVPDGRIGQFSAIAYDCRNDWEHFSARRTSKKKDVHLRVGLKEDVHSWCRRRPLHTHVQWACDVWDTIPNMPFLCPTVFRPNTAKMTSLLPATALLRPSGTS
ncbi:hypothetical protein E2C01_088368 [Portunus trituberculatus]|uniref:Uncharacterized protein n=1 Tax=Portunus trituberculatus TaxID=210409 RepID=A0A5B7JF75_PORTR|nr:hypothetical protein [Portunus trituberculatus]